MAYWRQRSGPTGATTSTQCARTLLLKGKASNIIHVDGERVEEPLELGKVAVVKAGVPHILIPEEDLFTFEWWDGDFIADECGDVFNDLTETRVGPLD